MSMKIDSSVNFDRLTKLTGPMAVPENSVVRQLASFERLAMHERELIWKTCKDATTYAPNSLVEMNDDAHYFLISGWACRQWIREDGRQQIIDFVLPGDTITPIRSPKHASAVSLLTLTSARFAPATSVHQLVSNNPTRYPGLTKAFAAAVNSEHQRLFDQLIRLGTMSSTERLADLLSELYRRLEPVNLASQGRFECPLTQSVLAEALGTSAIHMNRTFKLLEREGKISRSSSWINLRELHSSCAGAVKADMGKGFKPSPNVPSLSIPA